MANEANNAQHDDQRTRLMKDIDEIRRNPVLGVFIKVDLRNLTHWRFVLFGPRKSPFREGYFVGQVNFSTNYPTNPPAVKFDRPFAHPNVHLESGEIVVPLLSHWDENTAMRNIFVSIVSMLNNPFIRNPNVANERALDLLLRGHPGLVNMEERPVEAPGNVDEGFQDGNKEEGAEEGEEATWEGLVNRLVIWSLDDVDDTLVRAPANDEQFVEFSRINLS